jgi:hypothetical protein
MVVCTINMDSCEEHDSVQFAVLKGLNIVFKNARIYENTEITLACVVI